jgi:ubiquinone/menaquinone biosynthesis C-methylase UbiE
LRLLQKLLHISFNLLYHSFAWTYDLVAALVSLGRWRSWILSVLLYIEGPRVLELGYGPGHLQCALHINDLSVFGLDESRQMCRQAARRLRRNRISDVNLACGSAQYIPFLSNSFQTVVATFPSEYIIDPRTLVEVHRVLVAGGRFIVLPAAWITGNRIHECYLATLFRISHQTGDPVRTISDRMKDLFMQAGFQIKVERVASESSTLLLLLAYKSS